MDRGQDYGKIKKSIVISFVKGRLFPPEVPMHSVYTLHERSIYRELSDILELHYIELNKIQYERRAGEQSGIEKGKLEGAREIAANFKKAGVDIEVIAANTGLTKEEIEQL